MKKITFIGAGSVRFCHKLVRDVLAVPELRNTQFALMDINEKNLNLVHTLIKRDIKDNKLPAKVMATTDRREALRDADYIIYLVRVGGMMDLRNDIEIPLQFGVSQCIGDTLCAGGIMYGQRQIPVLLDVCKDIREVSKPGALLLNYANPNPMMAWAALHYGGVNAIGLCHGVIATHNLIARALKIPAQEADITFAGINHQTWATKILHQGKDLTGHLLEAMERDPMIMKKEKVRVDLLRRTGYFSTESNGHLSEYIPWYRKSLAEIDNWCDTTHPWNGLTGGEIGMCLNLMDRYETELAALKKTPPKPIGERSVEQGSYIIEALETGRVFRGSFNVVNNGIISNLPDDAIVEVPSYVDKNGISIPRVGDLPDVCASICAASIGVQRLAVKAAVTGDPTLLKQAMLIDPLVAAMCTPPEIWELADRLLVADAAFLPQFKKAIPEAKKRLKAAPSLARISRQEAFEVCLKSVEIMLPDNGRRLYEAIV